MSMKCINPNIPLLYGTFMGFTGVYLFFLIYDIFLIYDTKHTLWVLFRTDLCFEQRYLKYQKISGEIFNFYS